MNVSCPICGVETLRALDPDFETNRRGYECPNCGRFELSLEAQHMRQLIEARPEWERALLSHVVRRMGRESRLVVVSIDLVESILHKERLPTPAEQMENMILNLGDGSRFLGDRVQLAPSTHMAAVGAVNAVNFGTLGQELLHRGLVDGSLAGDGFYGCLTLAGWDAYECLRRGHSGVRKAFMAMPYGDSLLDTAFETCFRPAVEDAGYSLRRLDQEPAAGLIDDRLRVEIRTSRFLVADLTGENRGAYWEAGFAEGLGKPVIYSCRKSYFEAHKTHFDTNHHLTVLWEDSELGAAAAALTATIRATLPDEAVLE